MQLRVLSLNIWGVHYVSKLIPQRIQALIDHLLSPSADYDIIGLQEVWSKSDYLKIRDAIQNVYPHTFYFLSGLVGSGCCFFSKYPIIGVYEHRYALNGFPHKIQHGDYFAGKLICLCKILVRGLVVNVYNTHLHANYHHVIPQDIYLGHRVCQAFEVVQFIESTSSGDATDLTILLGDLNLTPDDLGFQLIQQILQLHDSFFERLDKEKFDPSVGNIQMTCDVPGNPLVKVNRHHLQGERIDYILYRSRHENVKCLESYPTLHRVVDHPENLHYSDHLAVFALLEIDEKNVKETKWKTFDMVDEKTRELIRSACLIVEESIERIQRERILWTFVLFLFLFLLFSFNDVFLLIFIVMKNLFCLIGVSISLWSIFLGKPIERNGLSAIQNAMRLRLRATHFSY